MNYYQEITLLPEAEIPLGFIWQNVFQQVHIALVENKVAPNQSGVAVGFPNYGQKGFPLGNKLRLFAKEQTHLEKLSINKWLTRLEDYCHIKAIKPVPEDVTWVSFTRQHVKSPGRIDREMQGKAERWSAKSGKPLVECLAELESTKPSSKCDLPFVYLHSQQTKQRSPDTNSKYPLFIALAKVEIDQQGVFDCYGLSAKSNGDRELGCVPQF
ncbi:type I-F CRISPR-associated endoribonuclease Cas6/Csy4 [Pseudoalteromonas sp. CnMc7-15]|uniref:type I-F CRISPR-associated endoribonuclease Cas6/Csy4 n=1 Tax=unclassified Pseudoalteromonas TaxID=194690 RepID=UPI001EF6A046|nr:type I-F CRISPR-associated endoribonuclease Cas6/Csy4 [Pseudoalteromonas sp. CnMc7-15]MCG7566825.1 type I-F CRISPR-associated endoribonuclease Cas6/Csy4 [Pseudoalteromonas sp. CnMc7-15]